MGVLQMRISYFLSVVFCASLPSSIFMQYFALISSEHMHLVGFVVRAFSFSQFGMLNLFFDLLSCSFTFVSVKYVIVLVSRDENEAAGELKKRALVLGSPFMGLPLPV
jgi:hypothetical protein